MFTIRSIIIQLKFMTMVLSEIIDALCLDFDLSRERIIKVGVNIHTTKALLKHW